MAETHTPDTPPLFDPTLPPSASLLFYLYAERVVPAARWGTKAPLAGLRVDTARLACALFAAACHRHRAEGLDGRARDRNRRGHALVRLLRAQPGAPAHQVGGA